MYRAFPADRGFSKILGILGRITKYFVGHFYAVYLVTLPNVPNNYRKRRGKVLTSALLALCKQN